jgi:MOSC domain-containing protein YiiM
MVWHGRTVRSAIWKAPVIGPVRVRGVNLTGDVQADGKAHGGPDKAVYGYAAEDLDWWRGQLGVEVGPGSMGENLTTSDLDLSEAVVGERWEIGSVVLQVTQPRIPCYKLGIRMGDDRFPERFAEARRHGVYLRILAEGALQAGDEIQVVERPAHGFRVVDVAQIFYDQQHRAGELLGVAELAESWQRWARRVLAPDG